MRCPCRSIASISVFLLAMTAITGAAAASEVTEHLGAWRTHVLTKGNMAGVETHSEDYAALVQSGPNILPEVFAAYENEKDPHVLYYYKVLIGRVAHFDAYGYSDESIVVQWRDFKDTDANKPLLSTKVGPRGLNALDWREYAFDQRNRLVQWWKLRGDFLARKKEDIATIVGKTEADFGKFDKVKARLLEKTVHCYGIYNIPLYIDLVSENNDPITFADFLRISNCGLFEQLQCTGNPMENAQKVTVAFPTRDTKMKVIRDWWTSSAGTYTVLGDLHKAVDEALQKARV